MFGPMTLTIFFTILGAEIDGAFKHPQEVVNNSQTQPGLGKHKLPVKLYCNIVYV